MKQILKELFTEKTRIILTILAIAWGAFAISSMLAIGEGLRITFGEAVSSLENTLQIEGGTTSRAYRGIPINQSIHLTKKDLAIIKNSASNIAMITPIYNAKWEKMQYKDKPAYYEIIAVDSNYANLNKLKIKSPGHFISPIDIQSNNSVIVFGSEAKIPGLDNPAGKTIEVYGKPFLVIGVIEKKPQLGGQRSLDSFRAFIPYTTYERLMNPQYFDSFVIAYKNPSLLDNMKSEIQKIIAINHHLDPNDDGIIKFHDFSAQQEKITSFFLGMQIFLGIIGLLTLIVAAVGIANVMFASVSRATHEIGIKMAVGAKTHQILFHYIAEALAATAIGGILGIVMSELLVFGIHFIPMRGELFETIGQPRPILSLSVIVVVILTLGLIGFLAGMFPALKAARVDPSEALRYE